MFDTRPREERLDTAQPIDHPDPKVRFKQYTLARQHRAIDFGSSTWTPEQHAFYHAGLQARIDRIEASDPDFKVFLDKMGVKPASVGEPA